MGIDLFGKPRRDREVGEALRQRGLITTSVADDELRARIMRAARPGLVRIAQGRSWWEWTAGWGRVAVPVGLAASLVAGSLLVRIGSGTVPEDTESSVMLSAAAGASGGAELGDQFVAQANDSWLFTQALGQ